MFQKAPQIAFFSHSPSLYGANRSLLTLIEAAQRRGWGCIYLSPFDSEMAAEVRARKIPVFVENYELWCHRPDGGDYHGVRSSRPYSASWFLRVGKIAWRNRRRVRSLCDLLRAHGINLVHSNSSWISIGASVAHRLGVPHVWHLREFGVADYGSYPDFGLARQRKRIASAGENICISRAVQEHFFTADAARARSRVIYNGVEVRAEIEKRLVAKLPRRVRNGGVFTCASIGQLHKGKGHDVVIEALAQLQRSHPGARLRIAGDGPEEADLRRRVLVAGLADYVEFSGRVHDMNDFYDSVDAVIVASRCEAMGRVAAEAMAYGVPVIGRNSGATPEIVEDGTTGLLFDGTAGDLADKMSILRRRPELQVQFSENALRGALRRFTKENYIDAVCQVFVEASSGGK